VLRTVNMTVSMTILVHVVVLQHLPLKGLYIMMVPLKCCFHNFVCHRMAPVVEVTVKVLQLGRCRYSPVHNIICAPNSEHDSVYDDKGTCSCAKKPAIKGTI
jgi:hypothetical protein